LEVAAHELVGVRPAVDEGHRVAEEHDVDVGEEDPHAHLEEREHHPDLLPVGRVPRDAGGDVCERKRRRAHRAERLEELGVERAHDEVAHAGGAERAHVVHRVRLVLAVRHRVDHHVGARERPEQAVADRRHDPTHHARAAERLGGRRVGLGARGVGHTRAAAPARAAVGAAAAAAAERGGGHRADAVGVGVGRVADVLDAKVGRRDLHRAEPAHRAEQAQHAQPGEHRQQHPPAPPHLRRMGRDRPPRRPVRRHRGLAF
jgi:hypothetical protein